MCVSGSAEVHSFGHSLVLKRMFCEWGVNGVYFYGVRERIFVARERMRAIREGSRVISKGAFLKVRFNSAHVGTMLASTSRAPVTSNDRR